MRSRSKWNFFPLISGITPILSVHSDLLSFLFNRYQIHQKNLFLNVVSGNRNPHSNNHDNLYTSRPGGYSVNLWLGVFRWDTETLTLY